MPEQPSGMLSCDDLKRQVAENTIETVAVVFADLYGRLMGKRFDAEFFLNHVAQEGTHGCDYLLTVDMEMTPVQGFRYSNWEGGYGDFHLVSDLQTLRIAAWLPKTAIVLCDIVDETSQEPVSLAPRSILRRQIDHAGKLGFEAKAGSELEYYFFRTGYREAAENGYTQLEPAGWYIEDYHILQGSREESFNAVVRRALSQSGIPVECTKGEWGKGQHELNVQYTSLICMADRHILYKQCLKEVADQQQISVTFMAKYATDHAGSSCHVHLSLWQDGKNAFAGDRPCGAIQGSDTFRWFLAGWMAHVSELMVFYAPTVNSYKRYQPGSWAPTRIAWSRDNRTAGFRIVGHAESLRIECRIPGADCNPYLVYAAAMASGLDGISRQLEPVEIYEGDVYTAENLPQVPRTLQETTDLFEHIEFAQSVFGEDVVEHDTHFFRTEQAAFETTVTDWEPQRYFERI